MCDVYVCVFTSKAKGKDDATNLEIKTVPDVWIYFCLKHEHYMKRFVDFDPTAC